MKPTETNGGRKGTGKMDYKSSRFNCNPILGFFSFWIDLLPHAIHFRTLMHEIPPRIAVLSPWVSGHPIPFLPKCMKFAFQKWKKDGNFAAGFGCSVGVPQFCGSSKGGGLS